MCNSDPTLTGHQTQVSAVTDGHISKEANSFEDNTLIIHLFINIFAIHYCDRGDYRIRYLGGVLTPIENVQWSTDPPGGFRGVLPRNIKKKKRFYILNLN